MALLLLLVAGLAHAEEKKRYVSTKMGFSAVFPYDVKEQAEKDGTGTAAAFDDTKSIMYMVGTTPPHPEMAKQKTVKQQLDDATDGAVQNVHGKLKSAKDVSLGKNPGREVVIEIAGGEANFRAYLVKDRLFVIGVVHKTGAVPPVSPADFFASFRLPDKK